MRRIEDKARIENYCLSVEILAQIYPIIKDHVSLVEYKRGVCLCNEGDVVDAFFFMLEGKAKVYTTQENGKMLLLCFYQDFELLGELEILSGVPYSTTVKTLSNVTCLSIDRTFFENEVLENKDFVKYLARSLSKKLLRNTQNCTFNMLYLLENRLATYILLSSENNYFVVNQTYLSELLATSLRHLTRLLTRFCEEGILVKENNRYLISDIDKLEELAIKSIHSFGVK